VPTQATVDQARRSVANRIRHLFGLRQAFRIGGVRYRELTADSLRHSLSRSGRGFKDFEATFADGAAMKLRCTRERVYADIVGPRYGAIYAAAEPFLRPGMRLLIPKGGTGYAGAWAASRVAPSGAVVNLELDEESVQYAQRRYRLLNASFERGGPEALEGETDGAFAGVLLVETDPALGDLEKAAREIWRLIRPSGWLIAAALTPAESLTGPLSAALPGTTIELLADSRDGWSIVKADKPCDQPDV
jgi:SAM-dependent methyltransferase